jgi:U4/U6.U5 tri-snRNP-associated protein 2
MQLHTLQFIAQVPLPQLLAKFDGKTTETLADGSRRRFMIKRLPRYLIVHYDRFKHNSFFVEKNPCLVSFPLQGMDMQPYLASATQPPTPQAVAALGVGELKRRLAKRKVNTVGVAEKGELVRLLNEAYAAAAARRKTKYNLIANICHDGKADDGTYRVHVWHAATNKWTEVQDLHVWGDENKETMARLVALSEAYVQVYELTA